ncbi:MAG: hypothetical protein U0169_25655 [Polyangiaceae bacterium]
MRTSIHRFSGPTLRALFLAWLATTSSCAGEGTPAPASTPAAPVCPPTLFGDEFDENGVNLRTGCVAIANFLGEVVGGAGFSLPVTLVVNDGFQMESGVRTPLKELAGGWLNVDEYVTMNFPPGPDPKGLINAPLPETIVRHTPLGDSVYFYSPGGEGTPTRGTPDRTYNGHWVTRPFDGSFALVYGKGAPGSRPGTGNDDLHVEIHEGNPEDPRTVSRTYETKVNGGSAYLLDWVSRSFCMDCEDQKSIHVDRHLDESPAYTALSSDFGDGAGRKELLRLEYDKRRDGQPGRRIVITRTALNGKVTTGEVLADASERVTSVVAPGRNDDETERTTIGYDEGAIATIKIDEGTSKSRRVLRDLAFPDRPKSAAPWKMSVSKIVDASRPSATQTTVVSQCEKHAGYVGVTPFDKYLTFNLPDGTRRSSEYAATVLNSTWPVSQLLRLADEYGNVTKFDYNGPEGGGVPGKRNLVTAREITGITVTAPDGTSQAHRISYSADAASNLGIPRVARISDFKLRNSVVSFRADFAPRCDDAKDGRLGVVPCTGKPNPHYAFPFLTPAISQGADERASQVFTDRDGYVHTIVSAEGVVLTFERSKDKQGNEVIDTWQTGVHLASDTRDHFGFLLRHVDFDDANKKESVTTYTYRPSGLVATITRTVPVSAPTPGDPFATRDATEVFTTTDVNDDESAITGSTLSVDGTVVRKTVLPQDRNGNPDGVASVAVGGFTRERTFARGAAGVLESHTTRGPAGTLVQQLTYGAGDAVSNGSILTVPGGRPAAVTTRVVKPMSADVRGGCQ